MTQYRTYAWFFVDDSLDYSSRDNPITVDAESPRDAHQKFDEIRQNFPEGSRFVGSMHGPYSSPVVAKERMVEGKPFPGGTD